MDLAVLGDIEAGLFRAYDIRGPAGAGALTPDLAYRIGRAVGSEARQLEQTDIIVGRDGRLSSPTLATALIAGLRDSGLNVLFIGMVPTPLLYFATNRLSACSGVMVTASHNPADHNGFKIVLRGKTLTTEDIQALKQRIVSQRFVQGAGDYQEIDITDDYMD